jgi:hypothetical protein
METHLIVQQLFLHRLLQSPFDSFPRQDAILYMFIRGTPWPSHQRGYDHDDHIFDRDSCTLRRRLSPRFADPAIPYIGCHDSVIITA